MKRIADMTLTEMMAEAAAFRGELQVTEDKTIAQIRSAEKQMAWGASEQEAAAHLMDNGATPEEAFLAVRAARVP